MNSKLFSGYDQQTPAMQQWQQRYQDNNMNHAQRYPGNTYYIPQGPKIMPIPPQPPQMAPPVTPAPGEQTLLTQPVSPTTSTPKSTATPPQTAVLPSGSPGGNMPAPGKSSSYLDAGGTSGGNMPQPAFKPSPEPPSSGIPESTTNFNSPNRQSLSRGGMSKPASYDPYNPKTFM